MRSISRVADVSINTVYKMHRMGRNYLKGRDGDRINAVLAAAGYNFGSAPTLARAAFVRLNADAASTPAPAPKRLTNPPHRFFTDDLIASMSRSAVRGCSFGLPGLDRAFRSRATFGCGLCDAACHPKAQPIISLGPDNRAYLPGSRDNS
jgi:hypothetical protein